MTDPAGRRAVDPRAAVFAGDWAGGVIDESMAAALETLGLRITRFPWGRYFHEGARRGLSSRLQNALLAGPRFGALNDDLVSLCQRVRPELVVVRRGTHVTRATLRRIRAAAPDVVLVGTCNDDPFSPAQPALEWRHFVAAVPEYDLVLASRRHNVDDFRRVGARRAEFLKFWYVPERHAPVSLTDEDRRRYGCDVVFVGHYEADKRIDYLNALAGAGVDLRVFGPDYPAGLHPPCLERSRPVRPLHGVEYTKALCAAKIALCFFSTLNRDAHTFRSFEIPASGTAMLCEHTEEMASMFTEGVEAEYFRSREELVEKVKALLADPARRQRIAEAGRRRVERDGHDVVSRMRELLGWVADVRAGRAVAGRSA